MEKSCPITFQFLTDLLNFDEFTFILQNMNEKCINFKLAISIEVLLLEKIDNVSQFSLNCIQYHLSLTYAMKELIATRYGFI